jgi:hypothetical protein
MKAGMDPHPMLTRETVTREMKAGTEDPHPMPTSRRGVFKSRSDIVPGRSRKYQPYLNFRRQKFPHEVEGTYLKAPEAYLRVLDNFERIRERVIPGGDSRDLDDDGEPADGRGDEQQNIAQSSKRQRSQSTESDDGFTKRKIDPSTFAWVIRDGIPPIAITVPSTQATPKTSVETPSSPRLRSSTCHALLSSLTRNGPTSSQARQSTSIMSLQHNIWLPMTNDELSELAISISLSGQLSQRESLIHTGNGLSPGTQQLTPHRTCSRTDLQSCETMGGTSPNSPPVSPTRCTRASSNLIELSASTFHNNGTCCSLTTISSPTSTSSGSKMLERGASLESQRSGDVQESGVPGGSSKRREACRRWNEGRCRNSVANSNFAHV